MSDFIASPKYYKKLIFWDTSLEPRRGPYAGPNTSGERFGREGAPFPTLVNDWIDIKGDGVGYVNISITMRMAVGITADGSETLMSLFRHSNSKPFHIYTVYETKTNVGGNHARIFGYDLNILSAIGQSFDNDYPPLFTYKLVANGRLMSQGRDFYINGESLNLVSHDGSLHGCPEGAGFFRQV